MAQELSQKNYDALVLKVYETYKDKIEAVMERLVKAARDAGFDASDVYTMHDDEYRWGFTVRLFSKPGEDYHWGDLDLSFELLESACRDGSREGVSFGLTSCYFGGLCCGIGYTPGNYTEDLWLRKMRGAGGLAERFNGFMCDLGDFVQALHDAKAYYLKWHGGLKNTG